MTVGPLGRLFDPSVGGTPRGSLTAELLVGFVGGFIDEHGSTDSLQFVIALGVLGWLVGAVAYSLVRRTYLYAAR
jgi:hypothetical protein